MNNIKNSSVENFQTDVLIVGGGGAGLFAAVGAFEAGTRKVTIIEKTKSLGGNARTSGGLLAVESPAQKRLGILDTADELFMRHMTQSNWNCDARLVRSWLNGSKDMIRWLEEKGMNFIDVIAMAGTTRTYHMADKPTGLSIVKILTKECEKKGVQILLETRAQKLLTDKKGNVKGVIAIRKDKEVRIAAKTVIIATGSISSNKNLLKRYFPEIDFTNIKIMADRPYSTGDGLLMAEEVGAAKDGLISIFWIGPHNHPYDWDVCHLLRRPHVMLVNRNGERYAPESLFDLQDFFYMSGMAQDRQPGRITYALLDEKILRDMINEKGVYGHENGIKTYSSYDTPDKNDEDEDLSKTPVLHVDWLNKLFDALRNEAMEGRVKISDSLDDIAKWIGADAKVLKNTVEQYNTFCRNGYDADFLKPKEYLLPINTPPFYAIRGYQGADSIIGGIKINHRMEVLDREHKPIGGLYAAGVATSGWLGVGYGFGGTELSYSIYSGYSAGKAAANY